MELIIKPNEKEMETLTKVSEITDVDYDGKEWHKELTIKNLFDALSDMVVEYHRLEEKLEDNGTTGSVFEHDEFKEWRDYNGTL